jgi:hypothetical protein
VRIFPFSLERAVFVSLTHPDAVEICAEPGSYIGAGNGSFASITLFGECAPEMEHIAKELAKTDYQIDRAISLHRGKGLLGDKAVGSIKLLAGSPSV